MVKIGVIGAGFISQVAHLYALSYNKTCQIVALSDARPSLCKDVAQKFLIPKTFTNYEDLIDQTSLDGVIISLPRPCIGPAVEKALNAKIPVLSEKPMAQTVSDAENLVKCADNNITPYYVGFMRRSDAAVTLFKQKLHECLDSKIYGEIQHVSVLDFCGEYAVKIPPYIAYKEKPIYRYPEWKRIPNGLSEELIQDYEYSTNVLIHDINLLHYLFGINFKPRTFRVNQKCSQTILLDAPNFSVTMDVSKSAIGEWNQVFHIYFQKGRLSLYFTSPLDRQASSWIEEISKEKKVVYRPSLDLFKWAFEQQADSFIEGITGRNSLTSTGEDSLKDIKIIEDLWKLVA